MFSPNMYGRNYNPAVPLFDTTDVPSLWTKGQMWMDTGALISNEEAGGNIRTFTGKKYNNLWASGAALDTQATFTLDPAYSLVTLDAFDQFGPFTTNLLDFPPRNNKFDQWTPATINSSPVPTVLAETPLPFPQTGTADRISYNNSAAFADGALVRSREVDINAGDTVPYEVTVAAANGDGFKTLMALKDDSDQITEQATVAFSNVFSRELLTDLGVDQIAANWGGYTTVTSTVAAPDGSYTAKTSSGGFGSYFRYFFNRGTYPGNPNAAIDSGQDYTYVVYQLAETTSRTYFVDMYASSTANRIQVSYALDTSGVTLNSFTGASTGPAYTAANSFRYENIAGTDWWKISFRVADYSGLGGNLNLNHYKYAEATYWKRYFYQGNHITGQQLLTVDDGVENLLGSVSNTSVSGSLLNISNWQGSGWTASTSAIAAPDGTPTATDLTTSGSFSVTAKLTESTASTWELGSSYVETATVTASIYIYKPSVTAAFNFIVFTGTPSSPVERINIKFDSSLQIIFFLSTTTGANPYTAERNLWIEDIGSTGWARITVSLHDFDSSSQELYFWPLYSSGASVTAWSPELRYGDWVSRGKNRVTSGEDLLDPDWTHTNATVTRSDEVTPAGTSSAVLVVPDSGSRYLNQDGPKQSWDIVDPSTTPCRVTLSAYYKDAGLGFAALGLSNSAGYLATAQIDLATGAAGPVGTHPNPASDLTTDFEDVGSGWKKCSFSMTLPIGSTYMRSAHFTGSSNQASDDSPLFSKITADGTNGVHIWGAKVTIGNPADARGYFVSGPQNLLGDGSDYSGWTAGTN
jgi:hypothetical protein